MNIDSFINDIYIDTNSLNKNIYLLKEISDFLKENNYSFAEDDLDKLFQNEQLNSIMKKLENITELQVLNLNTETLLLIEYYFNKNNILYQKDTINNDGLKQYLKDLSNIPRLTKTETKALLIEAQKGNIKARNTLVEANMLYVVSIAKHYYVPGLNLDDLINEGSIGLIKSINRYDFNKNTSFLTCATYSIRQAIIWAIINNKSTIRIPIHINKDLVKFKKIINDYLDVNEKMPSINYLSEKMNADEETIKELYSYLIEESSVSIEDLKDNNSDDSLPEEYLINPNEISIQSTLEEKLLHRKLIESLENLKEDEKKIIVWRYGLNNQKIVSLQNISDRLGFSRERARQKEEVALAKMAKSKHWKDLIQFLDYPDNAERKIKLYQSGFSRNYAEFMNFKTSYKLIKSYYNEINDDILSDLLSLLPENTILMIINNEINYNNLEKLIIIPLESYLNNIKEIKLKKRSRKR